MYGTPDASPFVVLGMVAMTTVVVAAMWGALMAVAKRDQTSTTGVIAVVLGLSAWIMLLLSGATAGVFVPVPHEMPLLQPAVVASILSFVALAASGLGRDASSLPIAALVGFHAFRLPLEIVMHQAASEGVMPPQMTWTGMNFDVVTGASALIVAALAALGRAPRGLLLAWNALGSVLLVVVVAVAVASTPPLSMFGNEPPHVNSWVFYAPFIWLPTVLVPAAAAGHVVLWRRLLSRAK